MDQATVERYLARIGYAGVPNVDLVTLGALQRAHMSTVPFENLDVYEGREVTVDLGWSLPKIIERRRGGWCFELNGGFGALLSALGFEVHLLAARVLMAEQVSPMPDHLTLVVTIDRPYLVDVGFGDSFIRPLALDTDEQQDGEIRPYRLVRDGHVFQLEADKGKGWEPQYVFPMERQRLSDFSEASNYLRTTPGLSWTAKPFATRLVPGGRATLLSDRLKIETFGNRVERAVPQGAAWRSTLNEWFGIT